MQGLYRRHAPNCVQPFRASPSSSDHPFLELAKRMWRKRRVEQCSARLEERGCNGCVAPREASLMRKQDLCGEPAGWLVYLSNLRRYGTKIRCSPAAALHCATLTSLSLLAWLRVKRYRTCLTGSRLLSRSILAALLEEPEKWAEKKAG